MLIERTSIITGEVRTRDIEVTQDQIDKWVAGEALIQDAMPNLSEDDREFILTGITSEEWEAWISCEDQDDDGGET